MLALVSAIIGFLSSILPNVIKLYEKRSDHKFDLEMARLRLQMEELRVNASKTGVELQSLVDEGRSLRTHDVAISDGGFFEPLRASIRPVITYLFFFLFMFIKLIAATFMYRSGYNAIDVANALLDDYTMAIFGSIMGFWFGSRAISKLSEEFKDDKPKAKAVILPLKKGK